MKIRHLVGACMLAGMAVAISACGTGKPATEEDLMNTEERRKASVGKLFGDDALVFGPGARRNKGDQGGGGIGVNGYLWRASLDTMSFMPLSSADPFGGVIITDWYIPPETPTERFKVQIYILDRQLRADGLRVTVFRQERDIFGAWSDMAVSPETPVDLENAILTRARQLRLDSGAGL
jgi:hypothetical protein